MRFTAERTFSRSAINPNLFSAPPPQPFQDTHFAAQHLQVYSQYYIAAYSRPVLKSNRKAVWTKLKTADMRFTAERTFSRSAINPNLFSAPPPQPFQDTRFAAEPPCDSHTFSRKSKKEKRQTPYKQYKPNQSQPLLYSVSF